MNEQFLKRMKEYIPEEMDAYLDSLEEPLHQSARLNPLKTDRQFLEDRLEFLKEPSPFNKDAWMVEGQYGLDPYHQMGLFYLQEPSASAVVEAMGIEEGDTVLDLCAAPGSKSSQIAGKLKTGFLVSNEIMPKRAQILLSNMERMGVENMMVTNMDSKVLCCQMPEAFDKILVDAPCSGEGMMKKHDAAREEWSLENIELCAKRQKEILANAIPALRPGGVLMYSTCTYAKEENEEVVSWILENFPEMKQEAISADFGRPGLPTQGMDASKVVRIFPMDGGEGHFMAKFRKEGSEEAELKELKSDALPKEAAAFLKEQLPDGYRHYKTVDKKDRISVYGMNHPFTSLKKGTVLRQGVYLGDVVKKRFEPAQAFFLSASMARYPKCQTNVSLEAMDEFFHGQQLNMESEKGWRALCYDGMCFGFGKSDGRRITNKLPKGMRLLVNSHLERKKQ